MKYSDASLFNPRSWKDANTFRAFTSGTEVHLAQNEEKAIIVHEIGHYLEKNLPIEVWSDISKLILARDIQATGRPAASTKAVGSRGDPEEGGFAGEYPATGPYTSRAYTTGDTEVMSRTVELLSRPADTVKMIDKDPVQTALILRGLRPEEYAEMTELRPFDKYLPQAARWKEKKSKKRKTRKKGKEKEVA
jgi:hypothetical protein